ncbi:MATE family efflux transporter [Kangiella sediminilitoris]|uniref:Multidrug-efflux transporter n=1 Tax=Kangiella sediminilitoris TaxID=1144748 RepID=A0A1B3B8V2_9GAMM|nr:MATE family efflux transporter [Kangiella sediminilitoris]AOE49176.1 MATE efflux family protein [Kangiella sediminilitoris]
MLNKDRSRQVLEISLPIVGGMISQNILNLVDAAMVGTQGSAAIAAIGISGFINFMAVAFFTGFAAGVQAMVSRRIGEGRSTEAAYPMNAALAIITLLALPTSIILFFLAPQILSLLNDDPELLQEGIPYLQARFAGILAIGLNFSFRSYWSAINQTQYYLRTLLVMHTINIFLNYTLIFGHFGMPELGTTGAGIGTTISVALGTVYYHLLATKHTKHFGYLSHIASCPTVRSILRISIPSALQQLFFAGGFTALFWIIGQVGTHQLAAANAITNVMLVAILPCIALGIGAATLVGRSLGQQDPHNAYRWGWDVVKMGIIFSLALGALFFIFTDEIMGIFLKEPEALAAAHWPFKLSALIIVIDAIGLIFLNALNGAGSTKPTLYVSIISQWVLFLPVAWYLGPYLDKNLTIIWIAYAVYRVLQTGAFIWLWQRRGWSRILFD